jgi:transcriptional regulator with XRE-family HTH domain
VSSDWKRLGAAVISERVRRGHRTLSAFARAAGLSRTTLDSIENGRKDGYSPTTIAALEHALGWRVGSVDRVLRGLEPLPDEDADLTALVDAWPRLSPGSRKMLRMLAVEAARAE